MRESINDLVAFLTVARERSFTKQRLNWGRRNRHLAERSDVSKSNWECSC